MRVIIFRWKPFNRAALKGRIMQSTLLVPEKMPLYLLINKKFLALLAPEKHKSCTFAFLLQFKETIFPEKHFQEKFSTQQLQVFASYSILE